MIEAERTDRHSLNVELVVVCGTRDGSKLSTVKISK